jgi:hypothetical protein
MELPIWVLVLASLAIAVQLLIRLSRKPAQYSYATKSPLLTAAERSFYGVLLSSVDDSITIFYKVRLADVIKPAGTTSRSARQAAFNKISSKHLDYVLCRSFDLSVLGAIELNDRSHEAPKRKRRDKFLTEACKSSGLPLLMTSAKRNYAKQELVQQLHDAGIIAAPDKSD